MERRLKVFLLAYPDAPPPEGFTVSFFRSLFFGADSPRSAPAPDNSLIGATATQYFANASDGSLRVSGDVVNWIDAPISDADVPHWPADMQDPTTTTNTVNWGESWPVAVALTLRGNGFTSQLYPSPEALRRAVLALPGGAQADGLVFLYSGLGGDGVRRSFSDLSAVLSKMSMSNVSTKEMPDGNPWTALWDEYWRDLPLFLCAHILLPTFGITRNRDGTLTPSIPLPATNLAMTSLSWLYHEYGHLVANLPDLYGDEYGPWGVWDIMGGPAAYTHFPMPIASYLRNLSGWLYFRELAAADTVIKLRPFESHNEALRLVNGRTDESLVLENRDNVTNWQASPPTVSGRTLLLYRLDKRRRLRVSSGQGSVRKATQLLARSFAPGQSVPMDAPPQRMPPTTRNALGELWWEVQAIEDAGAGDFRLGLRSCGVDLISGYRQATWEGRAPGQTPQPLQHDFFSGSAGHVVLIDKSLPVQGTERGRALYLHPRWAASAAVAGTYPLDDLATVPIRVYAKLGMPDEAVGSDGTVVEFQRGTQAQAVSLARGQYSEVCLDFAEPAPSLGVIGRSGATPNMDWIYLFSGRVVALPPVAYDFIAEARNARWSNASTTVPFGVQNQSSGEASYRGRMRLHNAVEYGPNVLFTHPQWIDNGIIQGVYPNVPVPSAGAYLRGLVGFSHGRTAPGGASVSLAISSGTNTQTLIAGADITRSIDPAQEDLTTLEILIPGAFWGSRATFTVTVSAAGSAGQDWVSWPYLALTTS